MKKLFIVLWIISITFGCNTKPHDVNIIEFGNLCTKKISEVINDFELIHLETTDESLIGYIDKIEFYEDKIYILDSYYGSNVFIFSKDGKFLSKLAHQGRGPGEFIYPMSFTIDQRGAILVLDANLIKLLKYNINDLSFIEEVPLPTTWSAPLSLAIDEKNNLYYFFKPANNKVSTDSNHFIISDEQGNILTEGISKPYSAGFLYGSQPLFHKTGGTIYGFTHYSNEIYKFDKKEITLKYQLQFGEYSFPEEDFFKQYVNNNGFREFYAEIDGANNKWIKCMYVSQSDDFLVASYQSVKNNYLGIFDKKTKKSINVRLSDLVDDIGLGFPLPQPIVNQGDYFIGWVSGANTKNAIKGINDDSNPVLIRYTLKNPK